MLRGDEKEGYSRGESTQITQLGRIINEVRKKAENARKSIQTLETSERHAGEIKETSGMPESVRKNEGVSKVVESNRKLRKNNLRYCIF